MKKIVLLMMSFLYLFLVSGQTGIKNTEGILCNYLGSDCKGNYVWGGAMNLAWNELNDSILKGKLQLNTKDPIALGMIEKLNHPVITKNDLDKESYYIKSGFGQKTVDIINKESREKFPDKTFKDLNVQLSPQDIISYAYLLKKVEYLTAFEKGNIFFEGESVKGFLSKNKAQGLNIKIITYENDDKFIISLLLKNEEDRLILAKGFDMNNPCTALGEISKKSQDTLQYLDKSDYFAAPNLHLDYDRSYDELVEKYLANKGFEPYKISKMAEKIKFDMDEKGARVENEGVIIITKSLPIHKRNLILNKPYWVIMERKNNSNPYFILGVRNIELMEKM